MFEGMYVVVNVMLSLMNVIAHIRPCALCEIMYFGCFVFIVIFTSWASPCETVHG